MSRGCAARSTRISTRRSFRRSGARAMSFGHLSRLLRSSTFRLAQIYMALFGASVLVLLGFLYWATAGYMLRQNDETIQAEILGLAEQYRIRGVPGLTAVIADRIQR